MKTLFLTSLFLVPSLLLAQSDVIPLAKKRSDNTLIVGFDTGGKTVKFSATGTLEWVSGATLTGASLFRSSAGLAIGTNVQAYDADLTTWAGISPAANVQSFLGAADYAAMRTALGLGSLAVESTAPVASGGTGQTTYTNGQLLIGNTTGNTLTKATLTAGSGITITNGNGSITIASTGGGGGLEIGTTTTSGASSNDILISNGTVLQKITPGTGVAAALANSVNAASGLLTYGIIGTSGASVPLLNAANTFGTAQVVNAASGFSSSSYLFDTQVAGVRRLGVFGDGYLRFGAGTSALLLRGLYADVIFNQYGDGEIAGNVTVSATALGIRSGADYLFLRADGVGVLNLRFSTTAQALRVSNTYTSATNHEVGVIDWQTTTNTLRMGSAVGNGGGTARNVQIIRGGVVKETFGANTTDHTQPVKLPSYAVSGLPSASTCGEGSMAWATDATSTTVYTTVTGGGSNKVLVISDGTNWIIH